MRGKINILFVASEIDPFAKGRCVAEFAGALPKYLKNMGHDIRLMMPNYKVINERKYVLRDVIRLQGLDITLGEKNVKANGKSSFLPNTKVQVYFLDNKEYFDRDGIYGDAKTGKAYQDNAERFVFFSKGCLETLKLLHWQPDIIHCNDWQTALIPVLLKTAYRDDPFFKNSRTLLTVHNFTDAGIFDSSIVDLAGLANFDLSKSDRGFNFLKLGLEYADFINTTSDTYAQEVLSGGEFDADLVAVLKKREDRFSAILNGVDYDKWNPETDRLIPHRYGRRDLSGKLENKKEVAETFDLEYSENLPLIGLVSPLLSCKGLDLVADILDQLCQLNLQLVVLGDGEKEYVKLFQEARKRHPDKLGFSSNVGDRLLHLIVAGCDMCLVPSKTEPCACIQMCGLRYGTIPIVRRTGILADTVENFSLDQGTGTGFLFEKYRSKELLDVVKKAVKIFRDKESWNGIIQNAMKKDFSWKHSSQKYVKLYQGLLNTKARNAASKAL